MFNRFTYENSRPDGVGVLEVVAEEKPDSEQRQFVPLVSTELRGEVTGPLASLTVAHTYRYTREQCDKVLAAAYRFPLPGDAAVTGVWVRFGEVEIHAKLKEREAAEKEYDEAVRKGQQAALLTRESPDVFTLHIAGLQPDQEVMVVTEYVQLARAEGSGWSLRIPLTTSPRYVRSDELTSRHAHGQPLALLRDPGHRFSLDLTLYGAGAVESATHELEVTQEGEADRVRLRDGEVVPDRDCVISWRPQQEATRPSLQVWTHHDPAAQTYFLALAAPPAEAESARTMPREVILLVDHSGSMEGPKWEAADWSVKSFLHGMTERDAFSLGLFHNTTRWLASKPLAATSAQVERAVRFLETHRDSGGTELGVALEQALDQERVTGECARHVLVVTDAEVSDAGRILRLTEEEARHTDRRRISVLCIDAAPNSYLAQELAERGGGVARFLTSAPEEEDITSALDEVLQDWSAPILTGLRLEVSRTKVESSGRAAVEGTADGWSSVDLGDLPSGRPLWVAGRVSRDDGSELAFRLTSPALRDESVCRVAPATEEAHPALRPLFGVRRINGLEALLHSGYDMDELGEALQHLGYEPPQIVTEGPKRRKVYAENVRAEAEKALRSLLVRESLDYGLQCSETAFVAVRTEAGRPVEEYVIVPNALPMGWSDRFLHVCKLAAPAACYAMAPDPYVSYCVAPPPKARGVVAEEMFEAGAPRGGRAVVFAGAPQFTQGVAVLYDSARPEDAALLPDSATFTRLEVSFPQGTPDPMDLGPGLALLIYVEDLASPRARVRLLDLLRQRGRRPLNLTRSRGQIVRIVLEDPMGVWATAAPEFEMALVW